MPVIRSDYDSDPERWRSCDRNVQMFGDVHAPVARRIIDEDLAPVLDIGGGQGYLETLLPTGRPSIVVDLSPTQLADAPHPKIRADASVLPARHRSADPELTDGYPPTPFDAEEAPAIVAAVFGDVHVERWDEPMTYLPDRDAVLRYCRSHSLHRDAADRVIPPVWLTKRGCAVYAHKP